MSASREKRERKQAESQGPNKKQLERQKEERRDKTIKYTAIVAAIVIVLAVASIFVVSSGVIEHNTTTLTVGNEKASLVDFNFYYTNAYTSYIRMYQEYGMEAYIGIDYDKPLTEQIYQEADEEAGTPAKTWSEFFSEQAVTSMQKIMAYASEARATGAQMSAEDREDVENIITSMKSYCRSNNISVASFLGSTYGKGMTESKYRAIVEREYLAMRYQTDIFNSFTYTDDQIETEYNENRDDYDVVDYRAFFFDGSLPTQEAEEGEEAVEPTDEEKAAALEEARALAKEMEARVTSEATFISLAEEYAPEDQKEQYANDTATLFTDLKKSNASADLAPWLFDAETKAGDVTYIETGTGAYVLYLVQRTRNEYNTVNARHILVQFAKGASEEPTEEEDKAALEKAESIFAKWNEGDRTEDSFAKLAEENSADTGSTASGGLYEKVYKGFMVPEFEDWIFDPTRKPGDTGIVKTTYGYHIMYFVGTDEVYWKLQVRETLTAADADAHYVELTEGKYQVTTYPSAIKRARRLPA